MIKVSVNHDISNIFAPAFMYLFGITCTTYDLLGDVLSNLLDHTYFIKYFCRIFDMHHEVLILEFQYSLS